MKLTVRLGQTVSLFDELISEYETSQLNERISIEGNKARVIIDDFQSVPLLQNLKKLAKISKNFLEEIERNKYIQGKYLKYFRLISEDTQKTSNFAAKKMAHEYWTKKIPHKILTKGREIIDKFVEEVNIILSFFNNKIRNPSEQIRYVPEIKWIQKRPRWQEESKMKTFEQILRETKYGKINTEWLEKSLDEYKKIETNNVDENYKNIVKILKNNWPFKFPVKFVKENLFAKTAGSIKRRLLLGPKMNLSIPFGVLNPAADQKDFKLYKNMYDTKSKKQDKIDAMNNHRAQMDSLKDIWPQETWEREKRKFITLFEHEYTHYLQIKDKEWTQKYGVTFQNFWNKTCFELFSRQFGVDVRESYFSSNFELESWAIDVTQALLKEYDLDEIIKMTHNIPNLFDAISETGIGDHEISEEENNFYKRNTPRGHSDDLVIDIESKYDMHKDNLLPILIGIKEYNPEKFELFINHIRDYIEDNYEII